MPPKVVKTRPLSVCFLFRTSGNTHSLTVKQARLLEGEKISASEKHKKETAVFIKDNYDEKINPTATEGAVFVVVRMGSSGNQWEPMGELISGAGGAWRRCQWRTGAGFENFAI